jgi:hypothetical protein
LIFGSTGALDVKNGFSFEIPEEAINKGILIDGPMNRSVERDTFPDFGQTQFEKARVFR